MAELIEFLPLLMFPVLGLFLFSGYPVAFVLGGTGLLFGLIGMSLNVYNFKEFFLIISRIYGGVVENLVLIAVPMFIFMGIILERSGIARDLLQSLQILTRRIPGGLALSVTLLGTIMAATTGIIGASVVMITLMALPIMLEQEYDKAFATGTIAASGTLGILIPPSIMLVIMGELLATSAGTLFVSALVPGLMLALLYVIFILIKSWLNPEIAPSVSTQKPLLDDRFGGSPLPDANPVALLLKRILPPLTLIFLVLGSIFAGFATPTEAAGVGAFAALILALIKNRLNFSGLGKMCEETASTTGMVFGVFIGATAFSYVFRSLGGDDLIIHFIQSIAAGPWIILGGLMLMIFLLGFFFDWIEITLIILPVFAPIVSALDFGPHLASSDIIVWFAILTAINLQTSFLTPPFGFALFFTKGAAPDSVSIRDIYRGVVPFVLLQLMGLLLVMLFPQIALWLPQLLLK
ncbi:TRAP transporter large permease [Emcibacter nanhaiensis]|uniref:TRAP transporter large permease protein n=1 Tax=Emcibacter nanhaiensis TaxID=1505037 RepID=A0A501PS65_9PROT|nr:TRAP transporter large permease subunit [Emcibacter nanhaiensis]TPD62804.1 TRAP transporter large permease subunit [Emcibacter nanhaiensis]